MRLAAPMVVLHAFSLGSWVYFFSLIEKMGEKELAISMVLKQLFSAITIPGFCLASTANTIVGQLVGSRKIDLIMPSIWKVVKLNYAILMSLALLTFIFRYPIVSLFTADPCSDKGYFYAAYRIITGLFGDSFIECIIQQYLRIG
jgi:Na+-driven multidrug efflux pump